MRIWTAIVAGALLLATAGGLVAHPHVWIVAEADVLFDDKGKISGLRHKWTFDEFYSAFATQGLDKDRNGKFDREELAPLAEENVASLHEFGYFTFVKLTGDKTVVATPKDYWLEEQDGILTLHFTLAFAEPVDAKTMALTFAVYDPTYYIAFSYAEKNPVRLAKGAPSGCRIALEKPQTAERPTTDLSDAFLAALENASEFGAQFARTAAIACRDQ